MGWFSNLRLRTKLLGAFGLVLNRASADQEQCARVAAQVGCPMIGIVPNDYRLLEKAMARRAPVEPHSALASAYQQLATCWTQCPPQRTSTFPLSSSQATSFSRATMYRWWASWAS